MTCKTLANKLNTINSTKGNKAVIKMVYRSWTMNGLQTATIKGVC